MHAAAVIMEKPSGLKECPRCGLRNRPGAYQCELCGWDFGVASDDWTRQVRDLEELGKDIGAPEVDDVTASRIESTISRPSEAVRETFPAGPERSSLEEGGLGGGEAAPVHGEAPAEEALAEAVPDPSASPAAAKAAPKLQLPIAASSAVLVAGLAALISAVLLVNGGSLDKPAGWALTVIGSLLVVFGISRLLLSLGKVLPFGKKTALEGQK